MPVYIAICVTTKQVKVFPTYSILRSVCGARSQSLIYLSTKLLDNVCALENPVKESLRQSKQGLSGAAKAGRMYAVLQRTFSPLLRGS